MWRLSSSAYIGPKKTPDDTSNRPPKKKNSPRVYLATKLKKSMSRLGTLKKNEIEIIPLFLSFSLPLSHFHSCPLLPFLPTKHALTRDLCSLNILVVLSHTLFSISEAT